MLRFATPLLDRLAPDQLPLVTDEGEERKGRERKKAEVREGKITIIFHWIRFFMERVVGNWSRFPREMAMALSLSQFKEHLGDALNHTV